MIIVEKRKKPSIIKGKSENQIITLKKSKSQKQKVNKKIIKSKK
jgi:hypothetical protein